MASWETYTNDTEEKTMILQTLKEKIHVVSFLLHGVKFLGVEGVSPSDFEDRL